MCQNTSQPHQKTIRSQNAEELMRPVLASPTDYGWKLNQNCFEPDWSSVPESLTSEPTSLADANRAEATSSDEENQNQTRLGVTVMRMMKNCDEQKNNTFFNTTKINSLMGHPSHFRYKLLNTKTEISDHENIGIDTLIVLIACTDMQI